MIGASLGHTKPQRASRYAHLDDVALRDATEGFAALLAEGEEELAVEPLLSAATKLKHTGGVVTLKNGT